MLSVAGGAWGLGVIEFYKMDKTHFKIEGLCCSEEAAVLKRAIGRKAGIVTLECDVVNGRMTVVHDPAKMSSEDIVSAVADTGMTALPWTGGPRGRGGGSVAAAWAVVHGVGERVAAGGGVCGSLDPAW